MSSDGLVLIPLNPANPEQAASKILVKGTRFVATLGGILNDILRLPSSVRPLRGLEKRGEIPIGSGGTTDIWRGTWNRKEVVFKAFRVYPPQVLQEAKKILWKLVPTWKRLAHENVLPFHGVDTSTFQLALVYGWAQNGNIAQYLKSNPDASRPELVRIHLRSVRNVFSDRFPKLLQVARGLQYLHSLGIVHGNLKGVSEPAFSQNPAKLMNFPSGQCVGIRDRDSPGLRLRSKRPRLESDVRDFVAILPMVRPGDHQPTQLQTHNGIQIR